MICPRCRGQNVKVLESRDTEGGAVVRRRRECDDCKNRFTTFERMETSGFIVIKKDGTREPYNRSKIEGGIWVACGKRPVTQDQINRLLSDLEQKWAGEGKELASSVLGKDVMKRLKELDDIAYIRFASVYRDFKDVETFKEELVEFLKKK